jgi:glycosyltransferase involved in cell wall biosynthesis
MTWPKVSVITPAFNAESTLHESCKSVLSQDYRNLELIIVTNGCTDNTLEIARYLQKNDKRVIVAESSKGKVPSRNKGLMMSRGDIIGLNDADDIWLQGKLGKQIKEIENGYDIVGGRIECINSSGEITQDPLDRPIEHHKIVSNLLNGVNPLANSSVIFKKSIIDNIGTYEDCFPFCEDFHFWLRAIKFAKFKNVDEVVMRYYSHHNPAYDHNIPIALSSFYRSMYLYTGVVYESLS